jgi:arginyl-tRNA synthetase
VIGADHHGWVSYVTSALPALGIQPERFKPILTQMVHLVSAGTKVKMSKRLGKFETAHDLIQAVGPDAVRYFYCMRSAGSAMEFDLDLAIKRSSDNPVYYVQYAHARLCQIELHAPIGIETSEAAVLRGAMKHGDAEVVRCGGECGRWRLGAPLRTSRGLARRF